MNPCIQNTPNRNGTIEGRPRLLCQAGQADPDKEMGECDMSVPAPERKPSQAEFIALAGEIDKFTLQQYGKPCYSDIRDAMMTELYHLSSKLLECVTRANDPYLAGGTDKATIERITIPKQQERLRLFNMAKGYVAALSNKYTELYTVRPVKHRYRSQKKRIGKMLNREYKLLKGIIEKEEARLKKIEE